MRIFILTAFLALTSGVLAREVCDVCVIGGGAAGIGAALSAGKCGVRTVLVERDVRLGGTAVLSEVTLPGLFHGWGGRQVVAGPCWELVTNAVAVGNGFVPDSSDFPKSGWWRYSVRLNPHVYGMLAEERIRQAGVKIAFGTFPRGLAREEGLWKVTLVSDAGDRVLLARTVVDATGNAAVAAMAGGKRLREPDVSRQPGSIIFSLNTQGMDFDAAALDCAWAAAVKSGELQPTDGPTKGVSDWVREGGGGVWSYVPAADNSTAERRADANWRGRQLMLRVLRFLRRQPGLERATIASSASETGVRETYRIVGETMITREDVLSGRVWPDSVCYAFWYVDAHSADRTKYTVDYPAEGVFPTIPFSAMLPRGVPGLLVAGRAVSSDHAANSAVRVQAACMAMGQAAGVAGALAAESACDVRDVPTEAVRRKLSDLGAVVPPLESQRFGRRMSGPVALGFSGIVSGSRLEGK